MKQTENRETFTRIGNGQSHPWDSFPDIPFAPFREALQAGISSGWRLVLFSGMEEEKGKNVRILAVMADDSRSQLFATSTSLACGSRYPSLTPESPEFHLFERELHEEFDLVPEGHPWLKPVRYPHHGHDRQQNMAQYPFFSMAGEEVHEVGVGPVHAGVIEPGHFRFMCSGEKVHHLQIQLGYQHRGMEKMFLSPEFSRFPSHLLKLAECIAGDTTVGHAQAHAMLTEALLDAEIPLRSSALRMVGLELERAAMHVSDLGALCNDIAYLTGSAVYNALRTQIINTTLAICGSRFGRGWLSVGGTACDVSRAEAGEICATLTRVENELAHIGELVFSSSGILARFEKTGSVDRETARRIGLVGLAARASGLARDVRADHPFGMYRFLPFHKYTLTSGDVFARAFLRDIEARQSLKMVRECLENLPAGEVRHRAVGNFPPSSLGFSLVEGWRGEIVHAALTDKCGRLQFYKVVDPSFHNWFALALGMRDMGISDFPLCNKSFDLSYAGFDL